MPPKKNATAVAGLTERQLTILALSFSSFETEPKVNFEKLATLANLGSKASATARYSEAKKKLRDVFGATATSEDPDGPEAPGTPDRPNDDEELFKKRTLPDNDEEKPAKKKKTDRKSKATPVKVENESEEETFI